MTTKNTNSDNKNLNAKMKYYEPQFDEMIVMPRIKNHEYGYNTNGTLTENKMSSKKLENTRMKKFDIYKNEELDKNLLKFFPRIENTKVKTDNEYDIVCNKNRQKYYNTQHLNPIGSKQSGGFGNYDRFASHKFGESSRNNYDTIKGYSYDSTFPTFLPYQSAHFGSNPYPEDSRMNNKKYTN